VAAPTQTPAAKISGWNKRDVTVDWNWSDAGVGIDPDNCETSTSSAGEGVQTLSASCSDLVGNQESDSYQVKVDKTPPVVTAAATTADSQPYVPGTWTNQTVTVVFTCSDALSGFGANPNPHVCSTVQSGGDGENTWLLTTFDQAENPGSLLFTALVDKLAPTLAPTVSPDPVELGGTATASPNAGDAHSGIATESCDPVDTSTLGTHTVSCTATDVAGNTTTQDVSYTVVQTDASAPTAAPTQSPAANGNGWNKTDVTVTWNWADETGGSGIDTANCTTSSTSSGSGAAVVLSASCADLAGNTGTEDYTVKVDKTAPSLAPTVSPDPVLLGGAATASPNASDGLSGIATASCGPVDTSTLGTFSVSCSATDLAGNTATASASYTVVELPSFTLASPALTGSVGTPYGYTFQASGTPAPTYSLGAGAPAWLSIDATTGVLGGTPPSGTTSFVYSVVATNMGGSATAGPFTVAVTSPPPASTKANLSVALSCPRGGKVGVNATCRATVKNAGPATAKSVVVALALPGSVSKVSASSGASWWGSVATWKVNSLGSGGSKSFSVTFKPRSPGWATIGAATASANPDPRWSNNVAFATMTITKR
jgi:hypothetical protein